MGVRQEWYLTQLGTKFAFKNNFIFYTKENLRNNHSQYYTASHKQMSNFQI